MIPMFNRDDAAKHINAIFGAKFEGLIEIAWTDSNKNAEGRYPLNHARQFDAANIKAALDRADLVNAVPYQSVYIGAANRRLGTNPNKRGYKAAFSHAQALWLDLDDEGVAERAKALWTACPPTSVIVTARRPWLRIQPWWKLDKSITDIEEVEHANKVLIAAFGGDESVFNGDRVMRLGGSINWATKEKRIDQQTETHDYSSDRGPYRLDTILSAFGKVSGALFVSHALPTPVASQFVAPTLPAADFGPAPAPAAGEKRRYTQADLRRPIAFYNVDPAVAEHILSSPEDGPGNWHAAARDYTNELIKKHGFSEAQILARAPGWTLPGWTVDQTVAQLRTLIRKPLAAKAEGRAFNIDPTTGEYMIDEESSDPNADGQFAPIALTPFDPGAIPRRKWIVGNLALAGTVTAIVAPPGVGKSLFGVALAASVTTGRDILGMPVHVPGTAWLINTEDDGDEVRRRLAAVAIHHGIPLTDLFGNDTRPALLINAAGDPPLTLARQLPGAGLVASLDVDAAIEAIRRYEVRVMIADPFAELHAVDENDNAAIGFAMRQLRRIAQETGAAVLTVVHSRKAPSGDAEGHHGNLDAIRGGSAQAGVIRRAVTLHVMTEKDAARYGIASDERVRFVRIDDAKAQHALQAGEPVWLRKATVILPNGGIGTGDAVGVLETARLIPVDTDQGERGSPERVRALIVGAMAEDREPLSEIKEAIAIDLGVKDRRAHDFITAALAAPRGPTAATAEHDGATYRLWIDWPPKRKGAAYIVRERLA